jgi:hypothetical protein
MTTEHPARSRTVSVTIGHDELIIRRRYETLSFVNDILIGLWFTIGSVLFFSDSTTSAGTWLFLIGSVELLIRPVIRLARNLHFERTPVDQLGGLGDPHKISGTRDDRRRGS